METEPSFKVNRDKRVWYCHGGCKEGGDVLKFVMMKEGVQFLEALRLLARRAGVSMAACEVDEDLIAEHAVVQDVWLGASKFFRRQLLKHPDILKYCSQERRWKPETLSRLQIGFAPGTGLLNCLTKKGFSEENILKSGLFIRKKQGQLVEFFKGRIMFPYLHRGSIRYWIARATRRTPVTYGEWSYDEKSAEFTTAIKYKKLQTHKPGREYVSKTIRNDYLYNEEGIGGNDLVIVTEGVADAVAGIQAGLPVVSPVTVSFSRKTTQRMKTTLKRVRKILIVNDEEDNQSGLKGGLAVASDLEMMGRDARLLRLPRPLGSGKVDLADFLRDRSVEEFRRLMDTAQPRVDVEAAMAPAAVEMDLSVRKLAGMHGTKISTVVRIGGAGKTCAVPKVVVEKCSVQDGDTYRCPHRETCRLGDGEWRIRHIARKDPVLVAMAGAREEQVMGILKSTADCKLTKRDRKPIVKVLETVAVTEMLVTPRADSLHSGVDSPAGEADRKSYERTLVHAVGPPARAARYMKLTGYACPNPRTQEATLLVTEHEPVVDPAEHFTVDAAAIQQMSAFRAAKGESVADRLTRTGKDIAHNLIGVFGQVRVRAVLVALLTFASVLEFMFDRKRCKGWVESLMVGDTGTAKTSIVEALITATGLGEALDSATTSRTGLAYNLAQFGTSWVLAWGRYATNDRGLLFIDELHQLPEDAMTSIRKGRSGGVLQCDRIVHGEHPCRTRLIAASNPKYAGVVEDELYGVNLIRQLLTDEDIRRFDMAVVLAAEEVDRKVIQTLRRDRKEVRQVITPDALTTLIRWAWSRTPNQVVFSPEAEAQVMVTARALDLKYGPARDVPLISRGDIQLKVARLAVAVAVTMFCAEQDGETVKVLPKHVTYVKQFLQELYDSQSIALDRYAGQRQHQSELTDEDYKLVLKRFQVHVKVEDAAGKDVSSDEAIAELLRPFARASKGVGRQELADAWSLSTKSVSRKLAFLRDMGLIRSKPGRSGGYQATPRFNRFIKRLMKEGRFKL